MDWWIDDSLPVGPEFEPEFISFGGNVGIDLWSDFQNMKLRTSRPDFQFQSGGFLTSSTAPILKNIQIL